jgi:nitroimidazol reductase NimA-like FMN-containing flavoprotein (pyridoxamine 5'-phosphate oxidase superfamily)
MMREEPRICFEVDTLRDLSEWKSVIGWGEFEELKDPDERKHALQILMDRNLPILSSVTMHLSPDWPFHSDDTDYTDGVVFRIKLVDKTGRFETNVASPAFAG